ncbi:hypothetical protein [Calothrix sp. PCC 6303]|uniref:hypothetical protein n=1 Tax=Calothrix sp. PCC 6303 TaxID=1170562 RepID=UPI0002A00FCC|nr:hypothetical protein [Calothrix sp. PCC 6303]AFZ02558.1 hypothetical protein Cal6303_3633 [Calothrix sp. PCC 6303]
MLKHVITTLIILAASPSFGETPSSTKLDINPEIIQNSPVLQRWQNQVPNVLEDIKNDPSFRTRLRFGYSQFPSSGQAGGLNLGIEDVFIGKTNFVVNGNYQTTFNGKHQAYGANLQYYLRPLGSYINFAPVIGYHHLESDKYTSNGINLGAKLQLSLSRGGAADISLTQSWVAPGSTAEVGLTKLSFGYSVTRNLRISTDIEKQNARQSKDSRVGLVLEWMVGK